MSGCERGGYSLPPLDRASVAHHGSGGVAACRTQLLSYSRAE
eukprot:COSAG01_NODE_53621_length_337_cov_306.689076_1_plen_41_part_10